MQSALYVGLSAQVAVALRLTTFGDPGRFALFLGLALTVFGLVLLEQLFRRLALPAQLDRPVHHAVAHQVLVLKDPDLPGNAHRTDLAVGGPAAGSCCSCPSRHFR